MSDLRTNYKDDVYTGVRKYNVVDNDDGSKSFTDVTEYVQQGDYYGAAQINEHNDILNKLDNSAFRDTDMTWVDIFDADKIPFLLHNSNEDVRGMITWENIKRLLRQIFSPYQHDSSTNSTYGAGTSSRFGHVKLSDSYMSSAGSANQSVAASSSALVNAYNTLNQKINNDESEIDGKADQGTVNSLTNRVNYLEHHTLSDTDGQVIMNNFSQRPIDHSSTTNTFGIGNGSKYGHLKLTDTTDGSLNENSGYAATPAQVWGVLTNLITSSSPPLVFSFEKEGNEYGFLDEHGKFRPFKSGAAAIRTRFYSKVECICAVPKNVNGSIQVNAESTFGEWQGVTADGVTVSHKYSSGWSHKVSTTVAGTMYSFNGTHHLNAGQSYEYDGSHTGNCYFISDADANS